jgi:hypothetical protein
MPEDEGVPQVTLATLTLKTTKGNACFHTSAASGAHALPKAQLPECLCSENTCQIVSHP